MIRRIFAAYVVELSKSLRLFAPWFGPGLVLAAVVAALYMHPITRDGSSDFAFVGYAVPASLNLIGFLMVLVYSAGLVAGEVERGTIRTVLVRPLLRGEFLAAKYLNAMTYAFFLTAIAAISAWVLAAVRGEVTGVDFGGELIYTGQEMNTAFAIALALNFVPHMTGAAYAVMISTLARRSATAITAAVGGWLISDYAKHALHVDRFLFSTYLDQSWMVFADRCQGLQVTFFPDAAIGLAVCAAWLVLFVGVAFVVIHRRNFGP